MLRLGLTGGIGAGKSTVARRLAGLGAVVVDADRLAREVVEPGSEGLAAVTGAFGEGVLAADGSLDRAALGAVVFADGEARRRLNAILHPRIAALTAERLARLPAEAIVVHDVPLLVENRMGAGYHLVLVVHSPVEERVRRLVEDRGMAGPDARARVAAQADDAGRRAAADVWLDNSGPVGDVEAQVDRLWTARVVPFAENLLARRPAPVPAGAPVVAPDPTWPQQAGRIAERVARAAGERAVRVDHIGATSVPGVPAVDVLDLQLVVTGPAAVADVRDDLDAAGLVRVPAIPDGAGSSPDGAPAGLLHRAADPARPVDLRVWPVQDRHWREALGERDRSRAGEPHAGE